MIGHLFFLQGEVDRGWLPPDLILGSGVDDGREGVFDVIAPLAFAAEAAEGRAGRRAQGAQEWGRCRRHLLGDLR